MDILVFMLFYLQYKDTHICLWKGGGEGGERDGSVGIGGHYRLDGSGIESR